MLRALLEGILLGITLAILIGPSFFALIQTSISKGFKSGLALAFGIFLSDLLCVFLAYFGASRLLDNPENKKIMGVLGGFILIVFGMLNIIQKRKLEEKKLEISNANVPLMIIKGFFLNILNPFAFLFWLGAITAVSAKYDFPRSQFILFFSGTLATVLATDVLKSYIALKIRSRLSANFLLRLNRIAGIVLILLGISLIYRVAY